MAINTRARWGIILLLLAMSSLTASAASYRQPLVDELFIPQSILTIAEPESLIGDITFAVVSDAGRNFFGESINDYIVSGKILLPNSNDDLLGCRDFTSNVTDEGDPLSGNFLLLERGGTSCYFSDKFVRAAKITGLKGVFLIGCSIEAPSNCGSDLFTMAVYEAYDIPAVYVASEDGQRLKQYLQTRRTIFLQTRDEPGYLPPIGTNCTTNLNDTTSTICLMPALVGSVVGTGPLVNPIEERAGLLALAQNFVFDPVALDGRVFLHTWDEFRLDATLDPCYPTRVLGVYCEKGHVVAIHLASLSLTGSLNVSTSELSSLSSLKYLVLADNQLSGVLTDALCQLESLIALQLDGNRFESLPECLGGGTMSFIDASTGIVMMHSTNGCMNLTYLGAKSNRIVNLPSSLGNLTSTLRYLVLSGNNIVDELPSKLLKASKLERFEMYGNVGLTFDFDKMTTEESSFSYLTSVFSILLRDCNLRGTLPPSTFDGLSKLETLDLRSNHLEMGPLPDLKDCKRLKQLILSNNQFQGGIPEGWSTHLSSLETFFADHNLLTQPLSTLSSLYQLQTIWLSYNRIECIESNDIGETIWEMSSNSLKELLFDHNLLNGTWLPGGLIPSSLIKLSISYNQLDSIPEDIWLGDIIPYLDMSHCNLTGTLPATSPPLVSDPVTGARALERLKLEGNPRLSSWPLPNWLAQSSTTPPSYVLDPGGQPFQCLALVTSVPTVEVSVDASFTAYHGCICSTGTFGVPPRCVPLPRQAQVNPYATPKSLEVGDDFAQIIVQGEEGGEGTSGNVSAIFVQSMEYASSYAAASSFSSSSFSTSSSPSSLRVPRRSLFSSIRSSHPLLHYPGGFTDAWYGEDRYSSGMSSRWTIELETLFMKSTDIPPQIAPIDTQQGQQDVGDTSPSQDDIVQFVNSTSSLSPGDSFDPTFGTILTSSGDLLQPVRTIIIRLHISRTIFSTNSDLSIYAGSIGTGTGTSTQVWTLSGSDQTTLDTLPTSTPFTSTSEYQVSYGAPLASLVDAVIVEVPVYHTQATVDFTSKNPSGTHFFASYSYIFSCPIGYEVSEETHQCHLPTLGGVKSALVVGLVVAAVLCILVFIWLMVRKEKT